MTSRRPSSKLFKLVNVIVKSQIAVPIGTIYDGLPSGALAQIEERDKERR